MPTFSDRLFKIEPDKQGSHLSKLYELTEASRSAAADALTHRAVFAYLERYHDADLGTPGSLVHFLESAYPSYTDELLASIARRPTDLTLWMANRILNGKPTPELKAGLIRALREAGARSDVSEVVRNSAVHFLSLH
jgi:hypothetical protein